MKKILSLSIIIVFCTCLGCGGKNEKKSEPADITQTDTYKKGLALVTKNKCLTCHAVSETITGPPYMDISRKYASYPDTIVAHLAHKIISGGNGVWGTTIFMTAHPDVSEADAEAMVKYVLLLSKQ
jgi:cytochrome c